MRKSPIIRLCPGGFDKFFETPTGVILSGDIAATTDLILRSAQARHEG